MPTKRTGADFWTDVLLVGGVVIVLSFSSTSAFFHWLDTHKNTVVERSIHH
jgi:hypothetical protein